MNDLPDLPIETRQRRWFDNASLIWLIPIGAVLVALIVAWQNYANQGRLIHVTFANGAGLLANSTELRFRDVTVGLVEDISLTEDLGAVDVAIRVKKQVSPFIDGEAQFWVVRPELTTQGVSGLETVLSGVFIEGSWDNEIGTLTSRFRGRAEVPLFRTEKPGLQISLRSRPRGDLVSDSPILFRGVEVGRIGSASIDPRGRFAVAEAIIYEPHDRLISGSTRFWDTSGFSINVGASGASIDFSSVASLLAGGVTFDTFVSGGEPAVDGMQFQVFDSEQTARDSAFSQGSDEELLVSVIFDDNISGLNVDANVELSGVRIGKVRSVFGVVDPQQFGDNRVRLNALLAIQPERLGLSSDISAEAALAYLIERSEAGMRAQLASGGLLSGGLKVQFVTNDERERAPVRMTPDGTVILPTVPSEVDASGASLESVLGRVEALPVEELMASAIGFLESARAVVASDAIRETPEDLRKLLATVTDVVGSDDVRAIPGNLNQVLAQIETVLAELETAQAVQRAVEALGAAAQAAQSVERTIAGVPGLVDELSEVARTARALPLDELARRITGIVESTDLLIRSEGVQALPEQLNAALGELNSTLGELRAGGAVANVNATLSSARDAADAVAASTEGLPELTERLARVLDQAAATIDGYNKGEALTRDAQAALRDIGKAADAIAALARTLERNPSSVLRGRN
jgi:paraquat-inducible protein B